MASLKYAVKVILVPWFFFVALFLLYQLKSSFYSTLNYENRSSRATCSMLHDYTYEEGYETNEKPINKSSVVPFIIHNSAKSGSHFLTQTLTLLGLPIAFEYGLRKNGSSDEKTRVAAEMYETGQFYGFSGAHFDKGKAQKALNGAPIDWVGISKALFSVSVHSMVKHVVLVRTNIALQIVGKPGGTARRKDSNLVPFQLKDLDTITTSKLLSQEKVNIQLLENACVLAHLSCNVNSHASIFVVLYESLLIDPVTNFNKLLHFLGSEEQDYKTIMQALKNGARQKTHSLSLYEDLGFDAIIEHTFSNDTLFEESVKTCFLRQLLAPFPREEPFCIFNCLLQSQKYVCPSL